MTGNLKDAKANSQAAQEIDCEHQFQFSHTEKSYNPPTSTACIEHLIDVTICPKCGEIRRQRKVSV